MPRPRKQKHYLDALTDPNLPDDRRMALRFLWEVDLIRMAEDAFPSPTDFAQDDNDLRTNIRCANCFNDFRGPHLYCDDVCQQIAGTVRYVRKAEIDHRVANPDIQAAIGTKLFMLTGGGYPAQARALSKDQRTVILERDQYTCKLCGKPADQVDHIDGDSSDPDNLRALCGECNRREAFSHTTKVTADEANEIGEMFSDMALRVAAPNPIYLCDDSTAWAKCWPGISGARRRLFNRLNEEEDQDDVSGADGGFDDVDGYLYDSMQKDD